MLDSPTGPTMVNTTLYDPSSGDRDNTGNVTLTNVIVTRYEGNPHYRRRHRR